MSVEYMLKMQRCEARVRKEIEREQISHPVAEYTDERVLQLLAQIEDAKKHTWPATLTYNF